jgi:hypothetical protein
MVIKETVYDAFINWNMHDQILCFDVVRAEVPKKNSMMFWKKDDIAIAVKSELNEAMTTYGHDYQYI